MANATITVIGSLGQDPELRYTASGAAVATLSVAATERVKDGDAWRDGVTTWYRVSVWRDYAEHVAESLRKGDQVFVQGRVKNRPYEKDGEQRMSLEIEADEIGPTLRFSTAKPVKAGGSGSGGQSRQGAARGAANDPWGAAPSGGSSSGDDSPPF